MKRVFVDANIVIDLLCERYPWFPKVLRIFSMGDLGQIELFCPHFRLALPVTSWASPTSRMLSNTVLPKL